MSERSSDSIKVGITQKFKDTCNALSQASKELSVLSVECDATAILRSMMEGKEVKEVAAALRVLRHFDPKQILELLPLIYGLTEVSVHYYDALRVMAMVPAKKLRRALIPLVFERLLDPDNNYDYYSWRLTVSILQYCGFDEEAQQVAVLALANDDPEVREVGAELIAELASH